MDQSTSGIKIVVGLSSPAWSHLQIELSIRLMLASRSHKALLIIETSPTAQGIEKQFKSSSLEGVCFKGLRQTPP